LVPVVQNPFQPHYFHLPMSGDTGTNMADWERIAAACGVAQPRVEALLPAGPDLSQKWGRISG
jgi:hypothetical protein